MYRVIKLLKRRPLDWASCVARSRIEFEKYYNHKVRAVSVVNKMSEKLVQNGGKKTRKNFVKMNAFVARKYRRKRKFTLTLLKRGCDEATGG